MTNSPKAHSTALFAEGATNVKATVAITHTTVAETSDRRLVPPRSAMVPRMGLSRAMSTALTTMPFDHNWVPRSSFGAKLLVK